MSTQRREDRLPSQVETDRAARTGVVSQGLRREAGQAGFNGRTAPPGTPERRATNSLHTDCRSLSLHSREQGRGSPPPGAGITTAGRLPGHRSPLQLTPHPTGIVSSLSMLAAAPAFNRRAERQDGKRDLYLLHAA